MMNYVLFVDDGTDFGSRLILPILLSFSIWEGQFFNILLAPALYTILPLMAVVYTFDFWFFNGAFIALSKTTYVLKDFLRMVDTTTWIVWAPAALFLGWNLIQDGFVPLLILAQWVLMPFNSLFFGVWTLILFPVSIFNVLLSVTFSYLIFT